MNNQNTRVGRRISSRGAMLGNVGAGLLLATVGCNAFDPEVPQDTSGFRVVIPTDVRTPTSARNKPPAITGGTVLVTRDGSTAVVSDAEQDRMVLVSMAMVKVSGTVALSPGDEPGRLIEDDAGRVHVVLRKSGAVATIDPVSATLVDRRQVCSAPRGLTLSGPDTLTVACADGKLVTMPASGGLPTRVLTLDTDLRDVMVAGNDLVVSRFKSVELLRLGSDGTLLRRDRPTDVMGQRMVPIAGQSPMAGGAEMVAQPFRPVVAWRTLPRKDGSVIVVHQRSVDAEIEIGAPTDATVSSYGGGATCTGISQNGVTVMNANGVSTNLTIGGAPLPVDATLLADDHTLIVAHAGQPDPTVARPFVVFDGEDGVSGSAGGGFGAAVTLSVIDVPSAPVGGVAPAEGTVAQDPGCFGFGGVMLKEPIVAIAANPANPSELVLQTRQPSTIKIVGVNDWQNVDARVVSFDDGSTIDTGFELFHRDSGGGIACASCHPEGAEDGNVWRFSDTGERKTQSLQANLAASAPFHWDGKLPNVDAIMSQVFVARMGGIYQSPERLAVLRDWLFSQTPPTPMRATDDPAVLRGAELFEATGCTDCHTGAGLTNNRNADVGTGEALQVPSLIGIGYRAPFMHDGCAKTLANRFDPNCGGGELHGRVRGITPENVADLVAYLESL